METALASPEADAAETAEAPVRLVTMPAGPRPPAWAPSPASLRATRSDTPTHHDEENHRAVRQFQGPRRNPHQ